MGKFELYTDGRAVSGCYSPAKDDESTPKLHYNHTGDPITAGFNFEFDEENSIAKITKEFTSSIVEHQDKIIMSRIQEIGGKQYEHITVDRGKVEEMLRKYEAAKVKFTDAYPHNPYCPTCYKYMSTTFGYCPACGQYLDWRKEGI